MCQGLFEITIGCFVWRFVGCFFGDFSGVFSGDLIGCFVGRFVNDNGAGVV